MILLACGALRIWIVAHTETIAQDGTRYVAMARQWSIDPAEAIKSNRHHPGYPAAISAVRNMLLAAGAGDELRSWTLAGQIVSVATNLAATAGLWVFAGIAFGWRIAWITTLLFGLSRKFAALGSDVLIDSSAVCMQIWAVVLAILVLDLLQNRSRWAPLPAAGAGAVVALGYLVRPEALLLAPLIVMLWIGWTVRSKKALSGTLACVAAMTLAMLLCAAPYALTIGTLTKRHDISHLVGILPVAAAKCRPVMASLIPATAPFYHQLINKLYNAMHIVLALSALIWAITYLASKFFRVKPPEGVRLEPRKVAVFWMVGWAVVFLPFLLPGYSWSRNVSYRYLIFQGMLLAPLGGAGMVIVLKWASILAARLGLKPSIRRFTIPVGVLAMAIFVAAHAARPLHANRAQDRQAGMYLREIAAGKDHYVMGSNSLALHYSELDGLVLMKEHFQRGRRAVLCYISEKPTTYFVISNRDIRNFNPDLEGMFIGPCFTRIGSFTQSRSQNPEVLGVYRVNMKAVIAEIRATRPANNSTALPSISG